MIDITKILSPETKVQSIRDSIEYIESRLETFYDTEQEKIDIIRNIKHAELYLSDNNLKQMIDNTTLIKYNNILHSAKSRLGIA